MVRENEVRDRCAQEQPLPEETRGPLVSIPAEDSTQIPAEELHDASPEDPNDLKSELSFEDNIETLRDPIGSCSPLFASTPP